MKGIGFYMGKIIYIFHHRSVQKQYFVIDFSKSGLATSLGLQMEPFLFYLFIFCCGFGFVLFIIILFFKQSDIYFHSRVYQPPQLLF